MKPFVLATLAGIGLSLTGMQAQAEIPVQYQVANFTLSGGGDPALADSRYNVLTDVTFQNLVLNETFSDATFTSVPLYDPTDATHTATTTLDTNVINLYSDPFFVSPHGTLQSATLTGTFSTNAFDVAINGTDNPETVNSDFTATLTNPTANTLTDIFAQNASNNATYSVGTFGLFAAPVPEPTGPVVFLFALGTTAVFLIKKRLTHQNS